MKQKSICLDWNVLGLNLHFPRCKSDQLEYFKRGKQRDKLGLCSCVSYLLLHWTTTIISCLSLQFLGKGFCLPRFSNNTLYLPQDDLWRQYWLVKAGVWIYHIRSHADIASDISYICKTSCWHVIPKANPIRRSWRPWLLWTFSSPIVQ